MGWPRALGQCSGIQIVLSMPFSNRGSNGLGDAVHQSPMSVACVGMQFINFVMIDVPHEFGVVLFVFAVNSLLFLHAWGVCVVAKWEFLVEVNTHGAVVRHKGAFVEG